MRRLLHILVLTSTCFLVTPISAQENDVVALRLIALARIPIEIGDPGRGIITSPTIEEYRVFSEWNYNRGISGRPSYFDLVAMVVNRSGTQAEQIEVALYRNRLVGEMIPMPEELPSIMPPHPLTQASWEGSSQVESRTIQMIDGFAAIAMYFGPFSTREVWAPLWQNGQWPWRVKYEIAVRCDGCPSTIASTSFEMVHGL